MLTCDALPKQESDFFDLLHTYFPCVYDIKYLMKSCEHLKGGLQKVAEELQVRVTTLWESFCLYAVQRFLVFLETANTIQHTERHTTHTYLANVTVQCN